MIAAWAAAYIGIPFKDGGRDHEGCDCWGLARLPHIEVLGNPDMPAYSDSYVTALDKTEIAALIRGETAGSFESIPRGQEQPGDFVVFQPRAHPWHVGLIVGDRKFLNVREGDVSKVERYDSILWRSVLLGFFRLKRHQ
jgi:cell wall-associated NlpC family hydrolase